MNLGFDVPSFGLVFLGTPSPRLFGFSIFSGVYLFVLPITVILKAGLVDMAESSLPFPYTLSPQDVSKGPDLPSQNRQIDRHR